MFMPGAVTTPDAASEVDRHFRLYCYAVLSRIVAQLQASAPERFREFPFLAAYQSALDAQEPPHVSGAGAVAFWDERIVAWEKQTSAHLPLRALQAEAGLPSDVLRLLVAAGLVEEDIRFGGLFAALQEPLAARRPCFGLLGWLLAAPGALPGDGWLACRQLLDAGLIAVDNRADPRAEWLLRVPPPIWDAVRGRLGARPVPGLRWQPSVDFPGVGDLILPRALHDQLQRAPALVVAGQVGTLVLRGMAGSGRRTTLGAIARALGRSVLLAEGVAPGDDAWRLLGPLATLAGALPVLRCDPAPGETLELPALPGYAGPVGVTLGRSGGLRGALVGQALSLNLPPPDTAGRRRFWEASGVPLAPGALAPIVGRFLLSGGNIRQAATVAHTRAQLDGRTGVTAADVHEAARALNRQALETLATPLEPAAGWGEVVLSAALRAELQHLEARCRQREQLRDQAGPAFAHSLNRGVRALFSGPSGTGKTLAARALAAELEMDVYRVDLAAVVNKYIGETERNLNQVLSRAEELDVLLLLDEGDALMTKRTEVRNANDRYANLETDYLLQRLETYEGIAVITTNAGSRIDQAFLRRLDVIVDFTPPEAFERWLIWQTHLPLSHTVSAQLLDDLASRCVLTGGQIRNATLHATLLALDSGEAPGDAQLLAAVEHEFRKAGATYPLRSSAVPPGQVSQLRRFAAELC